MKKFIDGIKNGLGILFVFVVFIIGVYLVKAWSGTDGLTAGAGDLLTYDKWNQMLAKISTSLGGIIYDSPSNSYQFTGSIIAGSSSVCDASRKGAFRTTSTAVQVCDGANWLDLKSFGLGTSSNPGLNCNDILTRNPGSGNGLYYIKPLGIGSPFQVYCDMVTDGGGWTLVVRINGLDKLHYNSNAVGTLSSPEQGTTAKYDDNTINLIKSTTGFRFRCGPRQAFFGLGCVFGGLSIPTGDCQTTYNATYYGLNTRNASSGILYGYNASSWNGCWDQTSGNYGTVWVK